MPDAGDLELIRGFCERGILPLPPFATRTAIALARDDLSNNDDLISIIASDSRLEFLFLAGAQLPVCSLSRCLPLSLSSSPSHNPRSHTVRHAVAQLGRRKSLSLLWLIALSDFLHTWPSLDNQIRDRLWRHSLLTGLLTKQLANSAGLLNSDHALAAGLAHDLGHLLIASPVPRLGILCDEEPDQFADMALSPAPERDHCRLGATLLTIWDAPAEVVASARHHHDPTFAAPEVRPLVVAVRLADLIAEHVDLARPGASLQLDTAPAWQQLAAIPPWDQVAHLHRLAIQYLPDTIILAHHVAHFFG